MPCFNHWLPSTNSNHAWHYAILWWNSMDDKSRHRVYKLERENDLFCSSLNYSGTGTATIYQIENSDYFYSVCRFSDGNLTDVNIYYVPSKTLQEIISQKSNLIKFEPGTGEWEYYHGELKDTYGCCLFLESYFLLQKRFKKFTNLNMNLS